MKRYYRLNTAADKSLFEDHKKSYYGICLGAHVFAYGENWITAFLEELKKPFFIDPMTYLFNQSRSKLMKKGQIKKSFEKLLKKFYRNGLYEIIINQNRHLVISDFIDDDNQFRENFLNDFVSCTLNFQREIAEHDTPSEESVNEFLREFLHEEIEKIKPEFLVTPYFYINNLQSKWYKITKEISKIAIDLKEDNDEIYALLCISKSILNNQKSIKTMLEDFSEVDGIIFWISNFDEQHDDIRELANFINLIKIFSKKQIINLYGGLFSIFSQKLGLNGVASGICYSESKGAEDKPPEGGGLRKRYYIPQSKSKAVEANARAYYEFNDIKSLCDCQICSEHIQNLENLTTNNKLLANFFSQISIKQTKDHFMLNRLREDNEIGQKSLDNCIKDITEWIQHCKKTNCSRFKINYEHLSNWLRVLKSVN